jgi:predicted permease
MPIWIRISNRFYRFLQGAYPREFREIYGEEMSRAFVEGCRVKSRQGFGKLARFWFTVLSDWSRTAPQEHLNRLVQDFRYSITTMRQNKAFTVSAIACLSLGIGVSSTLFSMATTLLTRPLQVFDPDRIVMFRSSDGSDPSYPEFIKLRNMNEAFSGLTGWFPAPVSLGQGTNSEIVVSEIVTGNYFDVLGVNAVLGRTFLPEEDRTPNTHPIVVLSDAIWRRQFGADPQIVGRTIVLNGQSFSVIGVMPPSFSGSSFLLRVELWAPVMMSGPLNWGGGPIDGLRLMTLGRLKPSVSLEQATADINRVHSIVERERPDRQANPSTFTLFNPTGVFLRNERRRIVNATTLLLAVVGIILVIACSNVASLLLVRGSTRRKEIAVRIAVGANRLRLVRQLLTESAVLSAAGAAGGILLTIWLLRLFSTYRIPIPGPYVPYVEFGVDWSVVTFTAVISGLAGLLFGIVPAWRASRVDVMSSLKAGTRSAAGVYESSRLRSILVVTEVAMSFVLLVAAGLFGRSLANARSINPGFDTRNVVIGSLNLGMQGYTPPRGREFYRRLLERLRSLPGVRTVSTGGPLPLSNSDGRLDVLVEGVADSQPIRVARSGADTGYFDALGIPILQGRSFSALDNRNSSRVVVISESLAHRFFAGVDPIGRRLRAAGAQTPAMEIIGVAKDVQFDSLGEDPQPRVYDSFQQSYSPFQSVLIATDSTPDAIRNLVKREVLALDPNLPVDVKTMQEHLAFSVWPPRVGAIVFGSMGLLAVLLACVGIYGVTAYSVTQRTREFGTRMAVGARGGDIVRMVVGHGMRLAAIGLGIGLMIAVMTTRTLATLLYGIGSLDPLTFLAVPVLLMAVTLLANYLPARRATKVDPLIALRSD